MGEFFAGIVVLILTFIVTVCTMLYFSLALWVTFKIIGLDVEGFTT